MSNLKNLIKQSYQSKGKSVQEHDLTLACNNLIEFFRLLENIQNEQNLKKYKVKKSNEPKTNNNRSKYKPC